jgi:NitT/TauT family transport system ATP-binding protein
VKNTMAEDQPLLRATGISLVYQGKRGATPALQDLNVTVDDGEFVSVLGPSGCGKSTLLKIAAGLIRPTRGSIELAGVVVDKPRQDVGVVFQKANLMPWKTVIENTLVAARAMGRDMVAARKVAEDYLALAGLEKFANHYPNELSGGMQQRVGLVRGLVHDPKVLLMDEPFAALDAMTREQMTLELQKLWMATKKSVLFITHSIPEAVFLSDRVLVLSERPGTVVMDVKVDLPRPRTFETLSDDTFNEICNRFRAHFSSFMAGG